MQNPNKNGTLTTSFARLYVRATLANHVFSLRRFAATFSFTEASLLAAVVSARGSTSLSPPWPGALLCIPVPEMLFRCGQLRHTERWAEGGPRRQLVCAGDAAQ